LELQNTCNVCGKGTEDSFIATIECTKAKALRHRMRDFWSLPKEENFKRTGEDWLLILLKNSNKDMHQAILLVLWRSWHLRNDVCHAKGDATIEQSARFLLSYVQILNANPIDCVESECTDTKGKKKVLDLQGAGSSRNKNAVVTSRQWEPPPIGWLRQI
jgi:hypothetical protein